MENKQQEQVVLRKVQMKCLDILCKFAEVCEKHDLRYYLAYGTLLGAIRHEGYIPWDDDIDVWMPRPDMEQFLMIADTEMRPYVINFFTIHNDASAKYRSQPCIEDHSVKVGFSIGGEIKPGYIWVDIMPLDGMPKHIFQRKIQCKRFSLMYALIGFARSEEIGAFNKEEKKGLKKFGIMVNEKLHVGKLLNTEKQLQRFERIRKRFAYLESDYVVGTTTSYTEKAIFLKKWFEGEREGAFENHRFRIPVQAERILESLYGDYLTLPPIEKRKRSHFAVLYDEEGKQL